jgi:hypothetical protein
MASVRVERTHLGMRHRGEGGAAGRGEVGRQSHADVDDRRGRPGSGYPVDVGHLGTGEHDEVHDDSATGVGHQPFEHGMREHPQPVGAQRPGLELGEQSREPERPLLGVVHDEALLHHHAQQLVERRPWDAELAREGGCTDRAVALGEHAQHPQGVTGSRDVGHVRHRTPRLRFQTEDAKNGSKRRADLASLGPWPFCSGRRPSPSPTSWRSPGAANRSN